MKKTVLFFLTTLFFLAAAALVGWYFHTHDIAVLNPKGTIGVQERNLIGIALGLMLIVVIPVFILTAVIVWKYRAEKQARYEPNWDHSKALEAIWWGFPCAIILILSVITWNSSHTLDPFKPLQSSAHPVTVEVVALDWKWLFIYPELGISSVNFFQFPVNTPVHFLITADAPMNSFWIPQLGGQMYAMPGMSTQLHLMASQAGSYNGVSANISGKGFAGMKFTAKASTQAEFDEWVASVRQAPKRLGVDEYAALAQPSENTPVVYYSWTQPDLYNQVVMKFMAGMSESHTH